MCLLAILVKCLTLPFKLLQVRVSGAMLNILMSMYEHVKAKVYMNGTKSYEFEYVTCLDDMGYIPGQFFFRMSTVSLHMLLRRN